MSAPTSQRSSRAIAIKVEDSEPAPSWTPIPNVDKPFERQVDEILQKLPPASEATYRIGIGKKGHGARPPNNFVLFRTNLSPIIRQGRYRVGSANTYGPLISAAWARADKIEWQAAAAKIAEQHAKMFPSYKYKPTPRERRGPGRKGRALDPYPKPEVKEGGGNGKAPDSYPEPNEKEDGFRRIQAPFRYFEPKEKEEGFRRIQAPDIYSESEVEEEDRRSKAPDTYSESEEEEEGREHEASDTGSESEEEEEGSDTDELEPEEEEEN